MKLPRFEYEVPETVEQAIELLGSGQDAQLLAGGQSLIPLLALRLSSPATLIDINRISSLRNIWLSESFVHLGALVRWRDIETSHLLKSEHPLLVEAIKNVGHYQIRNLGTVGGGLANADPASEMACIAVATDAEITIVGQTASRTLPASKFFLGALTTELMVGEIIIEIRLPRWKSGRRWGFNEFSRRRGDYAIAGVASFYDVDAQGAAVDPHITVFGAFDRPQRLLGAEAELAGRRLTAGDINRAADVAVTEISPPHDWKIPIDYRKNLVRILVERSLECAKDRDIS